MAGALLMVLVLAVLNVFPGALMALHHADARQQGAALSQSIIEGQRSVPFGQLQVGTQNLADTVIGGTTYQSVLETFFPTPGNVQLIGLRATVTWTERKVTRTEIRELWLYNLQGYGI